jgi:hypothetical protein
MPAKAEIRYSEIVGAASVSVTIPIIILDRVFFSFDADKNWLRCGFWRQFAWPSFGIGHSSSFCWARHASFIFNVALLTPPPADFFTSDEVVL